MTANKKLIVTISILAVALIIALTGVIVVLVTANQRASSTVNLNYTSTDVYVELAANAYVGRSTHTFYNGDSTTLQLSPTKAEGALSQTETEIVLTKENPKVVFEYIFRNLSEDIDAKIILEETPATATNVTLTYAYADHKIYNYSDLVAEDSFTSPLLPAYEGLKNNSKYIYIFAEVTDLLYDASFTGNFSWVLEKTTPSILTIDTSASTGAATGTTTTTIKALDGETISTLFYFPEIASARFTGYYVDADKTLPLEENPVTIGANTTIYADYQVSDLNNTYLSYSETNGHGFYKIQDLTNYTGTSLVIPDVYDDGTNGVLAVEDNELDALISNNTVTHLYLGNNLIRLSYLAANNKTLQYIEWGICGSTDPGWASFDGASALTEVKFSEYVVTAGHYSFRTATAIKNLYIPASMTTIYMPSEKYGITMSTDGSPFESMPSLETIIVHKDNKKFDSRDNCNALIYTDNNLLLLGSANTVIPDTVTTIGGYAFSNIISITGITIPSNVTCIVPYAFLGCTNLLLSNGGTGIAFEHTSGWCTCDFIGSITVDSQQVSDPSNNAILLTNFSSGMSNRYWVHGSIVDWLD